MLPTTRRASSSSPARQYQ
uniref:Uncharacterized protein n=1 Tax=Arundo donax TaxID=35708 RepID=A0A0A9BP67_ARUDO